MRILEILVPAPVGGTFQVRQLTGPTFVRPSRTTVAKSSRTPGWCCWSRRSACCFDLAKSTALAPWCRPRTIHDPGKIVLDVALAVALGGDCLADVGILRAEPAVFGPFASDPTVCRLIDALAASGDKALHAIRTARSDVRLRVWELAGDSAPKAGGEVTVDVDGALVIAHSEKQEPLRPWKKTHGHHPLMGFVDHGLGGTGEPVG